MSYNDYNPYYDVKNVYDAKVNWNKATTDEERKRQNEIANAARKNLVAYGYADVADQISASGADATTARKILDSYKPKTYTDTELINKNNNEANQKINQLSTTQTSDRQMMTGKYNKLEDTAYGNPFTTDEAKAILAKYDLSGLQARDNAVASGGASNGGNIDSYAAANALRQQASLVNQGQMVVLDAHNNKINNVKGILESLGVYLQDQDTGMQKTIELQQNEGQRLFENDQTAKNNEAARQEVYSNISGKVGDTVTKLLNSYMWNEDGSLKNASQDFQANINELEKALASTTDESEKARILEQLRIQEAARNQKIDEQGLTYGKTYKYQSNSQTEAGRQFDKQDATARETLKSNAELANAEIEANKAIQAGKNATDIAVANIAKETEQNKTNYTLTDIERMLKNTTTPSQELIDAYNSLSSDATTYTVDNPPPITGKNVEDDKNPDGDEETYAPYEAWNTASISLQEKSVKKPDNYDSLISDSKVDEYGKKAIDSVYSAVASGKLDGDKDGKVTNYELADFLITNSSNNHTDKKQLKKVFAYFSLNPSMLDNVEDVGKGQNLSGADFKYGVKYTN